MKCVKQLAAVSGALLLAVSPAWSAELGFGFGASGATTSAGLLLDAETAAPGDTVMAGIRLEMAEGWNTYWRNPGAEVGIATSIKWELPEGVTAGELQWPTPYKKGLFGMTNYVYSDEVILLASLRLSKDVSPGELEIGGTVSWLECKESCIPGKQEVSARLVVGEKKDPSEHARTLVKWQSQVPPGDPGLNVRAWWASGPVDDRRPLIVSWDSQDTDASPDFFSYKYEGWELGGAVEVLEAPEGRVRIRKEALRFEGEWPRELSGLVALIGDDGKTKIAFRATSGIYADEASAVEGKMEPAEEAAGETPSVPVPPAAEPGGGAAPSEESGGMLGYLLFAFVGGLILNVMPCVLPVISLKILSFVKQSREEPARIRKLGLIYTAGVVVSFLGLAAIVIAVQAAGRIASWGLQFSNPGFIMFLTALVVLVALNLFGLFEVALSGKVSGAAGQLSSKSGAAGTFFHGVLATTLATPCTAPFLAPALGFAFAQPPAMILVFFVVVGLGLALPYIVLSWNPSWLRFLPKPGPWMERFKIAMGFPMLGTGVWLLSLTTVHIGREGTFRFGIFLVLLSLGVWIWGEFAQRGAARRGTARLVAAVLVVAGWLGAMEWQTNWRTYQPETAANQPADSDYPTLAADGSIKWYPWTRDLVAKLREQGRPVFVDFTADWCATCQFNKKTAIEVASVRARLEEIGAVALKGDYTLFPPEIGEELQHFKRAGVPLNLVYPADPSRSPIVLPTSFTSGTVIEALEKAAKPSKQPSASGE